jgi:hypothetical protein
MHSISTSVIFVHNILCLYQVCYVPKSPVKKKKNNKPSFDFMKLLNLVVARILHKEEKSTRHSMLPTIIL